MKRFALLMVLALTACTGHSSSGDSDGGGNDTPTLPACNGQANEAPCDLAVDEAGCGGCTAEAGYACYCTPYSIGDASAVWSCGPTTSTCP